MRCPFCLHDDSQVKDSRPTEDGAAIRRRRQCPACAARFTTFERVQLRELVVVKKTGEREGLDRDKLARSVSLACRKRPIDAERVERLVSGVIRRLESGGETEVGTKDIGQMIMDALRTLDQVAYIRYASVYKDFREARDFRRAIDALGSAPELPLLGITGKSGG
jgi:transcriptional repressor NrdR